MTRRVRLRTTAPADVAKRRVQSALLVLLVLLAAVLAAGVLSAFGLYRSAENRYIHVVFPLQSSVRQVVLGMVQEETGVRGYMITTDRRSLRPYFTGHSTIESNLRQAERLTRKQPELAARLAVLRREIRSLQGYYDRLITFVADGRVGQRRARAEVLLNDRQFARFTHTATLIQGDIEAFVQETRAGQRTTFFRSVGTLVVAGFFALAIAGTLLAGVPERLRLLYRAEEEARERAEQGANAARALAHVSDAVVLVDDEGRVRSWNPAAERLFRAPVGRALSRRAAEVVDGYARLLEASGDFVAVDIAGETRWLAATVSVFDGGHVLTLRDVTEAYALERARADFVATASHELRTPLTSVYGAAQTLLGRDDLPEERRVELLRIVELEAAQLARIVDQMLLTARLTGGEALPQSPRPTDLRALCESVLAAARAREHPGLTLALTGPPALAPFTCDEGLLRQVLGNLVDNAIKYSPDGGRVEVRLLDQGDAVRIEVRDEGLGIAPSEQERVFEKFYRLDVDMSRGVGGSGLGLYIAREIVAALGGSIGVQSAPGEGSTFTLTLPRR
jgi:two-component system, OmpR family, phosphate regulon sensor histidine kinase PhoR